jgi:ELP3 family radical SAM enzyme/protein acetyltransferase
VTRVQLGVQHTDDTILRGVNRGCGHKHTLKALKLLKDSCFKVDIHLMPNLPGASVEKDKAMMDCVLDELHPDQVKVYPCTTTPFTKILEDYKSGLYKPYDNDALTDVVLYWKARVHPWIRNNRIVRDIPNSYIVAGVQTSSQRLDFQAEAAARGIICRCIRCREAGRWPRADAAAGELVARSYEAQGGHEMFLSWESKDRAVLFGFLRLRFIAKDIENAAFPELNGAALIRELHVYGRTIAVGEDAADSTGGKTAVAQHLGIGRRLLAKAERLALDAGYDRIAVISGVGVRKYYEGSGYALDAGAGEFMIKALQAGQEFTMWLSVILVILLVSIVLHVYL